MSENQINLTVYGNDIYSGTGGESSQKAQDLANEITKKLNADELTGYNAENYYDALAIPEGKETLCWFPRPATVFQLKRWADYVLVSPIGYSNATALLDNSGLGTSSDYIKILSGSDMQFVYVAGDESGEIVSTGHSIAPDTYPDEGALHFTASGTTGNWSIYSDEGNDTINASDGNNIIHAGTGNNSINLGKGNNQVYSEGQDTITGTKDGYQSVTLAGTQSQVTLYNALITDIGTNNTVSVNNSTINGGISGAFTFNGGDQNIFTGGSNDTVNATSGADLKVVHGGDNSFTIDNKLTFLNGFGKTTITVNGQLAAFGANDSNYTVNAGGNELGLFVADAGNETLNASGSTVSLQIYANTVSGANTNFVATGGSGNDILTAGTGNSTFSGGGGNNLFLFNKDTATNGNTVITDFASNSQNTIGLYNYSLDSNSLTQIVQQSQNNSNGDAVLNLEGHTITIQGVNVADLNVNNFSYINTTHNS